MLLLIRFPFVQAQIRRPRRRSPLNVKDSGSPIAPQQANRAHVTWLTINRILPPELEKYMGARFFVRSWYPIYYDDIMRTLKTHKYITLTGSPGVGKSMFYRYSVYRFRKENPGHRLITASFSKDRQCEEVMVFDQNVQSGRVSSHSPHHLDDERSIHLYDVPPGVKPPRGQMVCFSSPSSSRLSSMQDIECHAVMHFPTWKIDELIEANQALHFGIDPQEIVRRCDLFGGSARYCLTRVLSFLTRAEARIRSQASSVESYQQMKEILDSVGGMEPTACHHLFHYEPTRTSEAPYTDTYKVEFASPTIQKLLIDNLRRRDEREQRWFVDKLRGIPHLSSILGRFFEASVHPKFLLGGSFTMRSLLPPTVTRRMVIQRHLYEPMPLTCESVDGVYFDTRNQALYFIQATVSRVHPVNAKGFLKQIERLKIDVSEVALILVFVVPTDIDDSGRPFENQVIRTSATSGRGLTGIVEMIIDMPQFVVEINDFFSLKK